MTWTLAVALLVLAGYLVDARRLVRHEKRLRELERREEVLRRSILRVAQFVHQLAGCDHDDEEEQRRWN